MDKPADAACIAANEHIRGPVQFDDHWLTELPWLRFEGGKMFCNVCMSQDRPICEWEYQLSQALIIKHAERYSSQQFCVFFLLLI